MRGRRAISGISLALAISVAGIPVARAQPVPNAPPPPVVEAAPPPPVVESALPPPVVQNVPPPPLVQNVPPPPVVQPVPPAPAPASEPDDDAASGKVFLSGIGAFALAYGLTVLLGAIGTATGDDAAPNLYIPVAGPIAYWVETDNRIDAEGGTYLILSTLFQFAGIVTMIWGLAGIAGGAEEPATN